MDSALATNTNTSASKQCLSIQSSKSGVTSIPGLPIKIQSIINFILKFLSFIQCFFFTWLAFQICACIDIHVNATYLSKKTTSSLRNLHFCLGHNILIREFSFSFTLLRADANCLISCNKPK